MAPSDIEGAALAKRYYCDGYYYSYNACRNNGPWDSWGRWVALAVIVIVALLIVFLFSCYNTRRRRRRGMAPMYGMGWMGGKPQQGQNAGYYNSNQPYNGGQAYGASAPPYSPPINNQQTGNTFNSNEGYYGNQNGYGGQQNGVELQPPQNAYNPQRGGDPVYEAPMGPPPTKGDHIIR